MTKEELLSQLKDIHLPHPIGWWPLAPGWYILAALVLISVLILSLGFYRRQRQKKFIQTLKSELENIHQQFKDHAHTYATHLSPLLKRIALIRFPKEQITSLHGHAWEAFLNHHSLKKADEPFTSLTEAAYNPKANLDTEKLHLASLALINSITHKKAAKRK